MKKIAVGMSGGVDSSVTAYLLQKEGFEVTGLTFKISQDILHEPSESAKKVCDHLGIPHRVVDLTEIFGREIRNYFVESYQKGLTPNPCVMCNRAIKFGALLDAAGDDSLIATGHYIRKKGALIAQGADPKKDQSYFLALVPVERLARAIFPLGEYFKEQVWEIAQNAGLPVDRSRGESQDVCFIPGDYRDYLAGSSVPETPGDFIYDGRKVGTHRGIPFYSLGQRRGHGVAMGHRVFIREFDVENNRILMGAVPRSEKLTVSGLNRMTPQFQSGTFDVELRYQSALIPATVKLDESGTRAEIQLSRPAEIVAPGQIAAFYREGVLFGGGVIERAELLGE